MATKSKKKSSSKSAKAERPKKPAAKSKAQGKAETQAMSKARPKTKAKKGAHGEARGASARRKAGGMSVHETNGSHTRDAHHGHADNGHVSETAQVALLNATENVGRTDSDDQIIQRLFSALDACAKSQQIGHVAQDSLFDWGENAEADLHPDLAFVSFERWAPYRHVPTPHIWHVIPDLVVQIQREGEPADQTASCLAGYFQAGVRRVWMVDPRKRKVHDHESPTSARALGREEVIDGGDVIPGFRIPVGEVV
jgi:hypothetical protein